MLLGYTGGLGTYSDGNGHYYDDAGRLLTPVEDTTPVIASGSITELGCNPNAAYPAGSMCWGIQQGINANEILKTMAPAAAKPCMGTPVVKGISNCTLAAGAAAFALFMFMQNR